MVPPSSKPAFNFFREDAQFSTSSSWHTQIYTRKERLTEKSRKKLLKSVKINLSKLLSDFLLLPPLKLLLMLPSSSLIPWTIIGQWQTSLVDFSTNSLQESGLNQPENALRFNAPNPDLSDFFASHCPYLLWTIACLTNLLLLFPADNGLTLANTNTHTHTTCRRQKSN